VQQEDIPAEVGLAHIECKRVHHLVVFQVVYLAVNLFHSMTSATSHVESSLVDFLVEYRVDSPTTGADTVAVIATAVHLQMRASTVPEAHRAYHHAEVSVSNQVGDLEYTPELPRSTNTLTANNVHV
jgi:hypothetical protein